NVDYQAMDWPTLSTRRANKNPIAQGGWSAFMSGPAAPDMFEPVGHLALRSNCEKAWFGWPCDEAIEKLRAEFTMASSHGQPNQAFSQFERSARWPTGSNMTGAAGPDMKADQPPCAMGFLLARRVDSVGQSIA